ncbi:MAG: hypothetical protein HDR01_02905 [Lachnospiraceae bacterium]|nr:hypothetical protein [Lachnospiraceae bacterium]
MNQIKRKKPIIISLCALLFSSILLQGCSSMRGILLDIEISGCKVPMDGKIQKVYDNGLVLCETDGTIVDLASCEEMKGRNYSLESLHIGVPTSDGKKAVPSCMIVYVYNDSLSSQPLENCKIYQMTVSDGLGNSDEVSITVNGKDIFQTEPSEFLAHLEELGIAFDEDEKTKFLESSTGEYITRRQGSYMYGLHSGKEEVSRPDGDDFYDSDGNFDQEAYDAACKEVEDSAGLVVTEFKFEKLIEKSYN